MPPASTMNDFTSSVGPSRAQPFGGSFAPVTESAPQPPPPPVGSTPVPPPTDGAGRPLGPQGAVSLSRTAALEKTAIGLVVASAMFAVLSIPAARSVRGEAQAYLDGLIADDDFIEQMAPAALTTVVQGLAVLAAAIVVIVWLYRIAANHRDLQRDTRWGPGWAIGSWFVPPLLFIVPFLMLTESWKAADPEVPRGDQRWRDSSVSPIVAVWFVLYSLVPLALTLTRGPSGITSFTGSEEQIAERYAGGTGELVIDAAVSVAGAAAFVVMVRGIGARHRRFTGEDRA